jgi:alkanesulfonate monooxygenase SsuD/methylene tetrahydromethanopterin reductase-like flavin-dependent oxidoreductase (luciferase family)
MSERTRRGVYIAPFDGLASPVALAELSVAAEAAGWDGVFIWDHLLYSDPVRELSDPWICLAAIADRTERIALGPMVTPLARRRPQVVARQAATLDRLSGGRLVLGFGLGDDGRDGELSRFGEELDPRRRAAMLSEGLAVLSGLLSGERVEHRGEHYAADGVTFEPRPARAGGIPIWLAARWPYRRPVRRAAAYDGLFTIGLTAPGDLATLVGEVTELRGPRAGRFEFVVDLPHGEDPEPWARAGATWVLTCFGPWDLDLHAPTVLDEVGAVVAAGPAGRGRGAGAAPGAPLGPSAAAGARPTPGPGGDAAAGASAAT